MHQSDKHDFSKTQDIEALADLLDTKFRLPGTNWHFGLDSLIGLIPVIGDGVGATLGLYIVGRAWRLGVPFTLILRMDWNLVLDMILGAVPFLGDLFDFAYKSHAKNARLLVNHIEKQKLKQSA